MTTPMNPQSKLFAELNPNLVTVDDEARRAALARRVVPTPPPMSEQRRRGQAARLAGDDRAYGCHFGMRSTLERDRAEFFRGWDEIDAALGGRS